MNASRIAMWRHGLRPLTFRCNSTEPRLSGFRLVHTTGKFAARSSSSSSFSSNGCLKCSQAGRVGTFPWFSSLSSCSCCGYVNKAGLTRNQRLMHTTTARLTISGNNPDELEKREMMLPPLMPYPNIVWPRFINAIRNWFFIHFIIRPYFDKEFSMNDFLVGAKEAASVVANKISEGKFDELDGLVERSALSQIQESVSKFTVFQQQLLRVAVEDIFFAFPYQIGIIIPDEPPREELAEGVKGPPQTRHVEITVCLHILRGMAEMQKSGSQSGSAFNFHEFSQDERNKYNVMICNYRFFKDFTEGSSDPSWIINMVNHFLPAEIKR